MTERDQDGDLTDDVVIEGEIVDVETIEVVAVDVDDDDPRTAVIDIIDATEVDDDGEPVVDVDDDAAVRASGTPDESVMVLDNWQFELPATGDDKVDAALAHLVGIEGLPPAEHVAVYEAVHRGLQDALADLDRG